MAKGYLALEITIARIRFMHVEREGRGLKVLSCGEVPHVMNVSAAGELTRDIKDIVSRLSAAPARIFVTLCGQENFIRQLTIPVMPLREQDQAIRAEIEKFPAFRDRDFSFIYRVSPVAENRRSVAFGAVEAAYLKYVFTECHSLGIPFEHLEMAPLNIKELLPLLKAGPESQAFLVINDHISYLMVAGGGRYRLIYQAGAGTDLLSPDGKKVNESNLASLVGELQRALRSYLAQNRTERLGKLWMVWDDQKAPGITKAFASQMGLEVEPLGLDKIPLFNVEAGDSACSPINTLLAVPLIIHFGSIKAQFSLDHFIRILDAGRYIKRFVMVTLAVVFLIGAVIGVKTLEYYQKAMTLKDDIAAIKSETTDLTSANIDLKREQEEYLRAREGLLLQAKLVKMLNRVSWSEVFALVAAELPKDMSLNSFKFTEDGKAEFVGESLDIATVAELIRRVDGSSLLHNGKFEFLMEKTVENRKIFNFGISANLKSQPDGQEVKP
jgi:hypothetical protein